MSARLLLALLSLTPASAAVPADWTTPLDPFKISGNLYYVGSRDLAAYLVATPAGNILVNANLESSPAQIHQSVEKLGFKWADTKILLSSQAHYDHAAGAAQVLRETHARHMVMDGDVDVIKSGGKTDFDKSLPTFPPAPVDRILHDNDKVTLGGTTITAHKTAGHTKGCTTWTLQTKEGTRTLDVVIVGGWAANPGVSLTNGYPGISADFDRTFKTLAALPCDIFLGAHGAYFNLLAKLPTHNFEDREGYRKAIAEREAAYRRELTRQQQPRR
jgi:metallo-beta-lactamase class B